MLSKAKQVAEAGKNLGRAAGKLTGQVTDQIEMVAPEQTALFKNNLENVKEKATTSINASVTRANIAIDHAKESATDFSINKMHEIVHRVIHEKVGPKLTNALGADPDMFQPVRTGIGVVVDEIMDEVEVSINDAIDMKIKGTLSIMKDKMTADPYPCCCPNPITWLRATVLYTLFPHDKSIWANLRSPAWWFIKIISILPVYYVNTLFWVLVWFIKSKRDEFQLVNFIVELKKAHFISYGVLGSIMGNIAFIQCAVLEPHRNPNTFKHSGIVNATAPALPCAANAPGLNLPFWPTAIIFSTQIVLTWASAALIPCSQRLGERNADWQEKAEEKRQKKRLLMIEEGKPEEAEAAYLLDKKSSRRLKYWLIYDALCCIVILILCILAALDSNALERGPGDIPSLLHMTMWWCRVLYGWLCLPWMILQGFLYPMVLHTRSTAYNARGMVVPLANSAEKTRAYNKRHGVNKIRQG